MNFIRGISHTQCFDIFNDLYDKGRKRGRLMKSLPLGQPLYTNTCIKMPTVGFLKKLKYCCFWTSGGSVVKILPAMWEMWV